MKPVSQLQGTVKVIIVIKEAQIKLKKSHIGDIQVAPGVSGAVAEEVNQASKEVCF